jgi:Fe-S cluster biosynthesis and repair protein YggX
VSRMVNCVKLQKEAEGLDRMPYPGELGQKIFDNVSKEGWQEWLKFQTMLINENRLSPIDPKSRSFLEAEMEKFFFGEGSEPPPDFVAPQA